MEKKTNPIYRGVAPVPPDGGWGWVVVVSAFFLNLLNGGIFSVHGMMYEAFLDSYPQLTPTSAAWVISLQSGFCYVAGFSVGPVLAISTCRTITLFGSVLVSSGLAATAFTQDSTIVYLLFSFIAGFGMGFQCLPSSILVQNYFDRHRALAAGISSCGGSAGVFIHPPIFRLLMDYYGWRGALLLLSGIFLNSIPLALLLRPLASPSIHTDIDENKLELTSTSPQNIHLGDTKINGTKAGGDSSGKDFKTELASSFKRALDFSVMKTPSPWVTCVFYFLSYVGITAFYTFITVKCTEIGYPSSYSSILISIYGVLETIGRLFSGVLGNFPCVNRMYIFCGGMFICGVSSAISGFVASYALLIIYAIVLGLNIGSFVGLGCTVVVDMVGKASLPKVQGFNFLAGGLGNFVSLPILAATWQSTGDYNVPFFIVGACQMSAALMLLGYYLIFLRNKSRTPQTTRVYDEGDEEDMAEQTVYFAKTHSNGSSKNTGSGFEIT